MARSLESKESKLSPSSIPEVALRPVLPESVEGKLAPDQLVSTDVKQRSSARCKVKIVDISEDKDFQFQPWDPENPDLSRIFYEESFGAPIFMDTSGQELFRLPNGRNYEIIDYFIRKEEIIIVAHTTTAFGSLHCITQYTNNRQNRSAPFTESVLIQSRLGICLLADGRLAALFNHQGVLQVKFWEQDQNKHWIEATPIAVPSDKLSGPSYANNDEAEFGHHGSFHFVAIPNFIIICKKIEYQKFDCLVMNLHTNEFGEILNVHQKLKNSFGEVKYLDINILSVNETILFYINYKKRMLPYEQSNFKIFGLNIFSGHLTLLWQENFEVDDKKKCEALDDSRMGVDFEYKFGDRNSPTRRMYEIISPMASAVWEMMKQEQVLRGTPVVILQIIMGYYSAFSLSSPSDYLPTGNSIAISPEVFPWAITNQPAITNITDSDVTKTSSSSSSSSAPGDSASTSNTSNPSANRYVLAAKANRETTSASTSSSFPSCAIC